jgi:hypothetical protein
MEIQIEVLFNAYWSSNQTFKRYKNFVALKLTKT